MSNKTNLNPEGNLVVKGGITGESYLDIVSNVDIGGNTSIVGSTDIRGDLVVGGTLAVESTDLTTFAGDVTIDGDLIAKGEITFSNTTINVVETVNNFDGYILNADSDASLAYFQINSDVSNIQLEYNENTLTVGYVGTTANINFNAQIVNISNNLTAGGTASITGATDIGGTLDVTGNTSLTNTAIVGAVEITGDVDVNGTGTFSGELTVNNNASIVGDLTLSNSTTVSFGGGNTLTEANYFGTASTADIWNTPRNLTLNLIGDVAGSATFVGIDGSQNLSVDLNTTVTPDNVALSDDTTGEYVSTMSDTANVLVTNSNTSAEGADISLDLSDSGVNAGSYGVADQLAQFSVDEKGRITQSANVSIDIISGQVNDFVTAVRSNISNATGLDYNSTTGVVSVSNTTITAGTYNSNVSEVSEFVVNEQGQLTSAATSAIEITSNQITDFNANISTYITDGVYVTEANGVLDVTSNVIANDRDATLAGDYTFTGNVNLSGSTFQTPANVALLDTDQTFNADNIFTANIDLSSATVIDPRLVRTDTPATLTNDYAFVGNLDLTSTIVTATTQANVDNSAKVATTEYVTTAIGDLIGGAPQALDTLREISDSLNNNSTLSNSLVASIAAAESNVVTVGNDRISSTGNISMSGNLNLDTNYINNLQAPVLSTDAANKAYVDAANVNMQTYVDNANAELKTYTDTEKVDKAFKIGASYSFLLETKLANGLIISATNTTLANPATANNSVSFDNLEEVQNLFINTNKYDGPYAVLHQGVQNVGQANPTAADQLRAGNLVMTGSMLMMPGKTLDPTAPPEVSGAATLTSLGNIIHAKNDDLTSQNFLTNVPTVFYKETIGQVTGPNSESTLTIFGSNIFITEGTLDSKELYTGADTTGTMNAVVAYSNVEIGIPRAHVLDMGASTFWIGDIDNIADYTTVLDRSTGSTYTTGPRPLERMTVDGAITLGDRHLPGDLIVNGTIFFDSVNNVLKAIEADGITDLVQKSANATIDLGNGAGDYSSATVVGSTYYLTQVSAGTGMEITKDSANILTYTVDSDHVKDTALSNISVISGALAYNSTTGVITAPTSTSDISEGTGLYYTDARARSAISAGGDLSYDSATGVISYSRGPGDITGVTAGAGLTGGGTTGAVSLAVNAGTGLEVVSDQVRIALTGVSATSYGTNASTIPRFTVNGQGQITNANTHPIAIEASQVTDMSEAVDDRVNSLLVAGDNVSITYNDGANTLTIDADLSGDITGVNAGAGLTGGGSTGDVTVSVGAGTGINVNADDIEVDMADFDTDNLSEGSSNLYYTDARADARVDAGFIAKSTSDLSEGTNLYYTDARADDRVALATGANLSLANNNTDDLGEGSTNLYYTDARADSRISAALIDEDNMASDSATRLPSQQSVKSYVDTSVLGVVGGSLDLSSKSTDDLSEGSTNLYYTDARARAAISASGSLSYNSTSGVMSFTERTDAEVRGLISASGDISYNSTTGVISYSRGPGDITDVTAGNGLTGGGTGGAVTLNIGAGTGINVAADSISVDMADFDTDNLSEGPNNLYHTTGRARAAVDVSDTGGYGSLSYTSSTGIISYTGPSATEVRSAISGGDGIDFSGGTVKIDITDTDVFDSGMSGNSVVLRSASGSFSANVITANSFDGVASSAKYADLAEKYLPDADYEPGTVVCFGGEKEITVTLTPESPRVAGVISTNPAYMMNADADGVYVALRGRVPCKVIGKVKKGDVLVTSSTPGYAESSAQPHFVGAACIVGKSLQSKDTGEPGVVEIVV